jgi:hypothetical protein
MQLVYSSRIDATSVAPLIIAGLGALAACFVIGESALLANWIIVALVFLLLAGLPVWILTSTNYTFTSNELSIRCGPFSWKIPFRDITVVERTNSRRSGPALSMDRLRIAYGQGKAILISPENKEAFLRELYSRRNEHTRPQKGSAIR